ncbi:MAG: aminotransferase class V-fold PLP-dependent enzyme [Dehalococcoidia bacterium]
MSAGSTLLESEIEEIRADFPNLSVLVNGRPVTYLDSGATSHKPRVVIDAERTFYESRNSAVHRGAHTFAALATEEFESARGIVAGFVGAAADEIVWTSNATEGVNLLAYALSNARTAGPEYAATAITPGDEIVVTELEHHANLIPWQQLAQRTGARLRFIPVDDDGALDPGALEETIHDRTRVVAVSHVSNVLGVINPVELIVDRAHAVGAIVVLDACQSAPHLPLDLHGLDVDFAVFSGHKMLAPTGIGVLYGRRELLRSLPPFLTGGSMITTVTMDSAEFLAPPQRFEAGTQRVSQAIALAAAVTYLDSIGMDRVAAHGTQMSNQLIDGLASIPGVRVLGSGGDRVGLASFDVAGIHAHDIGQFLDDRGIAVRVGHHCAQPLHRRLGLTATTRASGSIYTTAAEIDFFLEAVGEARAFFSAPL